MIYNLIMCNFNGYRGSSLELILNDARTRSFDAEDEYKDAKRVLEELEEGKIVVDEKDKENILEDARERLRRAENVYEFSIKWDINDRKVIDDYLNNGITRIQDILTYEDIDLELPDPKDGLFLRLKKEIDMWSREYKEVYDKNLNIQQKETNKKIEELRNLEI